MVLLLFFVLSLLEHHVCALALWQSCFSLLRNSLLSSSTIDSRKVLSQPLYIHFVYLPWRDCSLHFTNADSSSVHFLCKLFLQLPIGLTPWMASYTELQIVLDLRGYKYTHNRTSDDSTQTRHDFENTYQGSTVPHAQTPCLSWCFIQWASNSVSAFVESTRYKSQYLQTCEYQMGTDLFLSLYPFYNMHKTNVKTIKDMQDR